MHGDGTVLGSLLRADQLELGVGSAQLLQVLEHGLGQLIHGVLAHVGGSDQGGLDGEQGRFFFGVCVLGLTALGTVGIPVLFGARGFLFAFSVAGFCRAFGPVGLGPALFLFGLPAFLWGPILFLAGTQSMEGSVSLFRRAMGGGREPLPFGPLYWERLALWGLGLFLCVVLEFLAAPALLSASARFVL